jgi:two-component system sensor histidine kinase YesM
MLLQPLVENAILHGLQGIDRRGLIRIRSSVEPSPEGAGTLTVEVSDNGCGADAERLSRALAEPPDRHHGMTSIGLANIRRRILLNHGQGYGLGVDAAPGSGTTVRLRLPAISPG